MTHDVRAICSPGAEGAPSQQLEAFGLFILCADSLMDFRSHAAELAWQLNFRRQVLARMV